MNHGKNQNIKKIMIVDDDAVDRLFVRKILNKEYVVLEAEDGQEAISMAQTEMVLRYGCNPHQIPARIYSKAGAQSLLWNGYVFPIFH